MDRMEIAKLIIELLAALLTVWRTVPALLRALST